jgi:hypothetical protein
MDLTGWQLIGLHSAKAKSKKKRKKNFIEVNGRKLYLLWPPLSSISHSFTRDHNWAKRSQLIIMKFHDVF